MVKDHSDSDRGNPLPPHGLLFPISSKGHFICTTPDRIAHTTAFVTPVVKHWLERLYQDAKPIPNQCYCIAIKLCRQTNQIQKMLGLYLHGDARIISPLLILFGVSEVPKQLRK